jgi:hypothetical protein
MTIAKNIEAILQRSSWIRKMFEEGARLKAIHAPTKCMISAWATPIWSHRTNSGGH